VRSPRRPPRSMQRSTRPTKRPSPRARRSMSPPAMTDRPTARQNGTLATTGIGINGYASTPYNVAVGGTDFADTFEAKFGGNPVSTYWSATNTPSNGSALSYIPEIPWNNTCGSVLRCELRGLRHRLRVLQQRHSKHQRSSQEHRRKRRPERLRERLAERVRAQRRQRQLRRIIPIPSGRTPCLECRITACGTSRTCRCSQATARGITPM